MMMMVVHDSGFEVRYMRGFGVKKREHLQDSRVMVRGAWYCSTINVKISHHVKLFEKAQHYSPIRYELCTKP